MIDQDAIPSFRRFGQEHFSEYVSWFRDPLLNEALGPEPDSEWLEHVLNDQSGIQYAIILNDSLAGVLGVALATPQSPFHVITDIAIHPSLRKSGLGRTIVQTVSNDILSDSDWKAYVIQDNQNAKRFFESLGWQLSDPAPPKNEMFEFTFFRKTV